MKTTWMLAQDEVNRVNKILKSLEGNNSRKVIQEKINLVYDLLQKLDKLQGSAHHVGEEANRNSIIEEAKHWGERLIQFRRDLQKAEF